MLLLVEVVADELASLGKGLPLDAEAGAGNAAKHLGIGMKFRKSGQQKRWCQVVSSEGLDGRWLQQVKVHVVLDEVSNEAVAAVDTPDGSRNCGMIWEVLLPVFVNLTAEGLAHVMKLVVEPHQAGRWLVGEKSFLVLKKPLRQLPTCVTPGDEVAVAVRHRKAMLVDVLMFVLLARAHLLPKCIQR